MDTRAKILEPGRARQDLQGKTVCWISGYFDPLLAQHVRRLRECAAPGKLLVIEVRNSARPLLPQRARAELLAALSMVDYVVLSDQPPGSAGEDAVITEQFVQHVLNRHRQEKQR